MLKEPPLSVNLSVVNVPLSSSLESSPLTTISLTPNHVLDLSSVEIILIPLTDFNPKSVNTTSFGKVYSWSSKSTHFLPSVVYCTLALEKVSFGFELVPNLKVTLSISIAFE